MFQSLMAKLAARKKKSDLSDNAENDVSVANIDNFSSEEGLENMEVSSFAESENVDGNMAEEVSFSEPQPRQKVSVLKIVIFTILFLLFATIGVGYYYISNIDWNQHKDKIAAEFSNITGKRIIFEGPVHLTLFPSPSLQAENIKIYNPGEDLDEPLAKIKSLVANLTLQSLLNGDFDVKMMSLVEPDIRLELLDNNKLNWDTPLSDAQRSNLENMQITLDSVLVKNATINWIDNIRKHNVVIDNINAEVIAQSIFGPYRIEGTYIKNENPEGFAFSIGKIANGLSTSVNAVINQPSTETFVRFDGSVLPQNDAINGNLIFESKKLMDFVNSNSDKFKLKPEYDYPLALTLELKSNKQKIEVTNFAVKYGDSAGAGNLLIPLSAGEYNIAKQKEPFRSKVEFGFNFATLDMNPIVKLGQELWNKYKDGKANYNPQLPFDVLADVKAVKATYNNQSIKDFKISTDILNNKITIRELNAVVPGDTAFNLKGDIYSDLGYLTFDLEPNVKTDELRQTLKWLGIVPDIAKDTLLRRVNFNARVAGNFNKISIAPMNLNLDNSVISGELGLINDKKLSVYAALNTNMFNVDDYFSSLTINRSDKSWAENVDARFQQISVRPDIYAELRLSADTLLYNALPYKGVSLNGSLQEGNLQITSLAVENAAGAKFNLKGKIKGFGKKAEAENLKFDLQTKNLGDLVDKMKLPTPNIDMKKFNNFSAQGILTGFTDRFVTKSIVRLENIDINYGGTVELKNGAYKIKGALDVKSPDFVKMVNDFNFHYEPKTFVLGLFNMRGNFEGNLQNFKASDLYFNIGSNTFQGGVEYFKIEDRPQIKANLSVNRLELDKFFYNNAKVSASKNNAFRTQPDDKIDFLERPSFDEEKFNFNFLSSFDFDGTFNISRLIYRGWNFDYCKFHYVSKGNTVKLTDFEADFNGGKLKTDFELVMLPERPEIRGNVVLTGYDINGKDFSGAKYGLKSGLLNLSARYATEASSFADMYDKLQTDGDFSFSDVIVKGWNIKEIYDDLLNRKTSSGLSAFVKSKLMSGNERIASGQGTFSLNNGRFVISDSQWIGEGYKALFNASASLKNWDGEFSFDIDFNTPDYLPNFKIAYNGPMNAPELNVDIEDLAVMYNQQQLEIQAREAAEQAALKEKMRKKLDGSLLQTKAMESELENVVRPDLALKKQKALSPDISDVYINLEQRLETIESDLAELRLVVQNPDITNSIIEDVDLRNERNRQYIEDLKKEIYKINLDNLNYSIVQKRDVILQQNAESQKLVEDYTREKEDLEKRISSIITSYSLAKDENFIRLDSAFQGQVLALNKISEKINTDYENVDKKDEFALDTLFREVSSLEKDASLYLPQIEEAYKQLFDYASQRVKIAEDAYHKQKREEEIKKKLAENTGSISVKGTGVSKTVVRDLEDIEKSEKAVDSKKAKVLNFSEDKNEDTPIVRAAHKPIVVKSESQGLVVKKTDGEISKATGVIIKK